MSVEAAGFDARLVMRGGSGGWGLPAVSGPFLLTALLFLGLNVQMLTFSGFDQLLAGILPDCLQYVIARFLGMRGLGEDEGFVHQLSHQVQDSLSFDAVAHTYEFRCL